MKAMGGGSTTWLIDDAQTPATYPLCSPDVHQPWGDQCTATKTGGLGKTDFPNQGNLSNVVGNTEAEELKVYSCKESTP